MMVTVLRGTQLPQETFGGGDLTATSWPRVAGAALTRLGIGCDGEILSSLLSSAASNPGQRYVEASSQSCCSNSASGMESFSPAVGALTGQLVADVES